MLKHNEDIDIEDIRRKVRALDELEKKGEDVTKERTMYCKLAVDWSRQRMHQLDEESREAWEERAAIAEYDGGLSRKDAEALAWNSVKRSEQ